MDPLFANWLILLGVFGVAVASPGPDFVMAVRNSVLYSRRAGIMTAIGFAFGVAIHVAYCLGGIALLISKSILLFSIVKYIGAAYLFYVGFKAIKSKGMDKAEIDGPKLKMTDLQALRSGFITNLFNPKATMFFLALFTQIVAPETPLLIQSLYGATCIVLTGSWFSMVAVVLTTPAIRQRFLRFSEWIDRACGVLFIALGVKLVLTKI
jgi:RhtB (resistance to homoserine/threonine) family protein